MDHLFRTFSHAARKLRQTPGATAIAIIAFGLGIGLTAAMFGVLQGVFLRGLPFEASHQILHLERNNLAEEISSMEVTQHDFVDWAAEQTSFEQLVGWTGGTVNVAGEGSPERYDGCFISPGFIDMLRVEPIHGRAFRPDDGAPGAAKVMLLSYRVWRMHYGSDPSAVGRTVRANGEPTTIIGVMGEVFEFPISTEVWMPLQIEAADHPRTTDELATLEVVGRLQVGSDLDGAQTELSALASRLAAEHPDTNEGVGAIVQPFFDEFIGQETKDMLGIMLAAVLLVLLVACFNVANLLIGRASLRGRELAVRSALGSGRTPLIFGVLAESILLAGLGGVLGLGIAYWALARLDAAFQLQPEMPFWIRFYLDPTTIAMAVTATLGAALVAGIVPAVQASRTDIREVLGDSTRGSTSFRLGRISRLMVIGQVAVSAALLIAAGLVVKSVVSAHLYDHAFDGENVMVARLGLFEEKYPEDADRVAFFERLREKMETVAEVETVAFGTTVPTDTAIGAGGTQSRWVDHRHVD
ncbi:MAG: ABC transporter permease, partial [Acidobacteriota bacterium]